MLGRDLERRAAGSLLESTLAGRGRALFVAGEAGIGKTTLVRSIVEQAESKGALVRWGACWEGGSLLPFAPWVDALRRPGGDRCGVVAAHLTDGDPEMAPDAAAAQRARGRLFGEVVDAIAEAARTQPQVVVLEDLHWADAPSLELVRAAAPRVASMAALLVATYRDEEFDAVGELAGVGGAAEWLTLGGLGESDVSALLAEVLGRQPTTDEVRSVHAGTGGNPLFATQVGRLLAAGGGAAVPAGVLGVLERRLARLSPACDRILAVASVLGTTFEVRDAISVSGEPSDVVVAALDEAARARLAHPVDGRVDRWSFAHDLVRAVRYEALGVRERAQLHRAALDALSERETTSAGVLAHHAARATFEPTDIRPCSLAVAAAREAMARLAWPEASALCERALDVAPPGVEGDRWRAEALLAAGDARLRIGDEDRAARAFGEAAALARRHGWPELLARAALGFAAGLASFEVPLLDRRQVAVLEEAAAALEEGAPLRPLVLARLSVALSLMGADDRRLKLADEAVRLARAAGDPAVLAAAIAARCDAIAGPDHVAERLGAASEIVELARRVGDIGLELLGRRHRVVALLELRDLPGFDAEVAAFERAAERLGDPLYRWYVPLWQAMRAHADGKLAEAEALARRAREVGESGGSINARILERVVAMCIAVDRGDVAGIDAAWNELKATYPELLRTPVNHVVAAWLGAETGRIGGVRPALTALAQTDLARLPRDQEWLTSLAQVAIGAGAAGDQALLRRVYEELLPYVGLGCFEGIGAVDRGVVDRFLVMAAGHLADRAAVERHVDAALAGGEASGRLVAAHTVADCARALAATGASQRAGELAVDAIARYQALGLDHQADRLRPLLTPVAAASEDAALVREGDGWAFTYAGTTVRVRHAKGIADLAVLLANREREIHVRVLEGLDGMPAVTAQPALDDTAVAAYRGRLRDLEAELNDAERDNDIERSSRLAAERDALIEELARNLGLGGRRRRAGSDPDERLRKAVSARIKASIDRLAEAHPALGRHLRLSVRTGYHCSYVPERPVTWRVERHDATRSG